MTKRRALVLSGGGSHGAYQVGALKALTEFGKTYSVVAGVSVGAINGIWLAQASEGNQRAATLSLETLWNEVLISNSSVYKPWYFYPFNYVASLWKGSLNHTKPLRKILDNNYNPDKLKNSGVELMVGAVSLNSTEYKCARSSDPKVFAKMLDWVMASGAMPIIFEPIKVDGEVWVDGGVRNITPLGDIITNFSDIEEIDVILADSLASSPPKDNKEFTSVLNVATRCMGTAIDEVHKTDLDWVDQMVSVGIKINVYAPEQPLAYEAFDFNPTDLKAAIELGYQETLKKIT